MSKARSQEVLWKGSYARATREWTWLSGESLLLLVCCICGLGASCVFASPI